MAEVRMSADPCIVPAEEVDAGGRPLPPESWFSPKPTPEPLKARKLKPNSPDPRTEDLLVSDAALAEKWGFAGSPPG